MREKKDLKYIIANNLLYDLYGSSTGHDPAIVNNKKDAEKIQNIILLNGSKEQLLILPPINGIRVRIIMASNKPNTPPNLLGIDRRIAYAKRKYHSGTI